MSFEKMPRKISEEAGELKKSLIVAVFVFVVGFVVSKCKAGSGAESTAGSFNLGEAGPNEVVLVSSAESARSGTDPQQSEKY